MMPASMTGGQLLEGQSPEGITIRDLTGSMRRLSVGSDTTESFEFVSPAPSVRSVDDGGGGGVAIPAIGLQANEPLESPIAASVMPSAAPEIKDDSPGNDLPVGPPVTSDTHGERPSEELPNESDPGPPVISVFWAQYPTFKPNPKASFKKEFARLAKHQGWDNDTKSQRYAEAQFAEVAFHLGDSNKLDRWQALCQEVGIQDIPTSITQCKRALKSVRINLCNLIDHRRNPDQFKLRHFKSYSEFQKYTRKGRTYPRMLAKQEGFIKALLRKI